MNYQSKYSVSVGKLFNCNRQLNLKKCIVAAPKENCENNW